MTSLEKMSQVMLSLKVEQTNSMNNINVLLNDNRTLNLFEKIKEELGTLSSIHAKMQECESFMLQIAQAQIKSETNVDSDEDNDNEITG